MFWLFLLAANNRSRQLLKAVERFLMIIHFSTGSMTLAKKK